MIACFWHASQPKLPADFASSEGASEEILTILGRNLPRMTRFCCQKRRRKLFERSGHRSKTFRRVKDSARVYVGHWKSQIQQKLQRQRTGSRRVAFWHASNQDIPVPIASAEGVSGENWMVLRVEFGRKHTIYSQTQSKDTCASLCVCEWENRMG